MHLHACQTGSVGQTNGRDSLNVIEQEKCFNTKHSISMRWCDDDFWKLYVDNNIFYLTVS